MKKRHFPLYLFLLVFVIAASCKTKPKQVAATTDKGTYFSLRQFATDQMITLRGEPILLTKKVIKNGKKDSTMISMDTMDWTPVFKTFFEADISDKKFLGHYNFSIFEDESTDSRNLEYDAKDNDLFTRRLLIMTDPTNNKIKSIYIETDDKERAQKLLYKPRDLIQIQQYEKSLLGSDKSLVTRYEFNS